MVWATDIAQVGNSHARLVAGLARLTDARADARRPSLLPGWTVGHVVTHLARNADSHVRMIEGALRGEIVHQYPGGNDQRAADIEAGAQRPAEELVADAVTSAARLEEVWAATPDDVWRTGWGRVVSGDWPLAELPFRRWREVEIHHVDLGLAYGVGDWPDEYVEVELARSIAGLPARLGAGPGVDIRATDTGERWMVAGDGSPEWRVTGERRILLAWIVGRGGGDGFPALGPWTG